MFFMIYLISIRESVFYMYIYTYTYKTINQYLEYVKETTLSLVIFCLERVPFSLPSKRKGPHFFPSLSLRFLPFRLRDLDRGFY